MRLCCNVCSKSARSLQFFDKSASMLWFLQQKLCSFFASNFSVSRVCGSQIFYLFSHLVRTALHLLCWPLGPHKFRLSSEWCLCICTSCATLDVCCVLLCGWQDVATIRIRRAGISRHHQARHYFVVDEEDEDVEHLRAGWSGWLWWSLGGRGSFVSHRTPCTLVNQQWNLSPTMSPAPASSILSQTHPHCCLVFSAEDLVFVSSD